MTKKQGPSSATRALERRAAALRANLVKRKATARAAAGGGAAQPSDQQNTRDIDAASASHLNDRESND